MSSSRLLILPVGGEMSSRRTSWARSRARRVFFFRLAFGSLAFLATSGAGLLFGLVLFGGQWVELRLRKPLDDMIGPCAGIDTRGCGLLSPSSLDQLSWLIWIVPAVVLAVNWWKGKAAAEALDDRLVGRFNEDFLRPVGRPGAASGSPFPLPWIDSLSEERAAAWQSLKTLTRLQTGSTACHSFAWGMIVGRPGSGKTRMVEEFARRLRTGTVDPHARPGRPFGAWLRRVVGTAWLRPGDPWHVGHLPELVDWDSLRSWRPGSPTLLLLDDPAPGVSDRWLEALYGRRSHWRFPVRLVIVNQSIPAELPLHPVHQGAQRWAALDSAPPMPCPPQILARKSRFTREDIRSLLIACDWAGDGLPRRRLFASAPIERFLDATKGNPLLVELGFQWVRAGKAPDEITEPGLYESRAENVLRSFAAAGISRAAPNRLNALAAATLVGPRALAAPLKEAFDCDLPQGDALCRLVPGDDRFDPYDELPAVLPHQIGDAVVLMIVNPPAPPRQRESAAAEAARIVAAGFAARPAGWLRAVQRFAGQDNVIAEALTHPPMIAPGDTETRRSAAIAYIQLGLYGRLEPVKAAVALRRLVDQAGRSARGGLIDALDRYLLSVMAADRDRRDSALLGEREENEESDDDSSGDPFYRFVRSAPLALIGATLIERRRAHLAPSPARKAPRLTIGLLHEAVCECPGPTANLDEQPTWVALLENAISRTPIEDLSEWLLPGRCIHHRGLYTHGLTLAVADQMARPQSAVDEARWLAMVAHARLFKDRDACRQAVSELEALAMDAGADRLARQRGLADGLSFLALAGERHKDPTACLEIVQAIERLAGQVGLRADPAIQLARAAITRIALAAGTFLDVDEGWARVKGIAHREEFEGDVFFQVELAKATRIATSFMDDVQAIRTLALVLEEWAKHPACKVSVAFQQERACVWNHLAFAAKEDAISCREAVARVEEIAASPVFAADAPMQSTRAQANSFLAPHVSDLGELWQLIERVDAMLAREPFDDDVELQFVRVQGWRYLSNRLTRNAQHCREAVLRLEAVGARQAFENERRIQLDRLRAWLCLETAAADDADLLRQARARIDDIIEHGPFGQDAEFRQDVEFHQDMEHGRTR